MTTIVRRLPGTAPDSASHVDREWLVTNGLGGYASGTVEGIVTRRYHGLLVAALPAPIGRMVMLSHVEACFRSTSAAMTENEMSLVEFRLELGLPIWRYEGGGMVIEKRVLMTHRQNTVHLAYRLIHARSSVRVELRPFLHVRHFESPLRTTLSGPYSVRVVEQRVEIEPGDDLSHLRLLMYGNQSMLTLNGSRGPHGYREEQSRGYAYEGSLWSPGFFHAELDDHAAMKEATLVASTEPWKTVEALTPDAALQTETNRRLQLLEQAPPCMRSGVCAELVLAADQFLVSPAARPEDATRATALGTEARTVIAGYHWFTDWGRDTMISLEGLTLATGREREACLILRTFASYVRDGLIPNMFPDGQRDGLYHTADATLWFFHAIGRYVSTTGDDDTLKILLPVLRDIIDHHVRGTRFGIAIDPADGLLRQGADGYALTWMDAKVDGDVITPRRGKAVEINALFYNALCLLGGWLRRLESAESARPIEAMAARLRESFNRRFWYDEGRYLYDVVDGVDGDDSSCRPNQVMAISLPHPVLDASRWGPVLEVVRSRLLTPFGLRTLAPGQPGYRSRYYGDLRSRDGAYHQGTVWPWLIGPYVDAWERVHPDDTGARAALLAAFSDHLSEAGIGTISEIFDAESPYTPRGCISQAWSVAEVVRVLNSPQTRTPPRRWAPADTRPARAG
jgi:predicted glycogen debranching enzyme